MFSARLQRSRKYLNRLSGLFSSDQEARIRGYWAAKTILDKLAYSPRWFLRPFHRPLVWLTSKVMTLWFEKRVERWRDFNPPTPPAGDEVDLVFFIPEKARGWILEGICNDIAKEFRGSHVFHYDYQNLPRAKACFVAHYSQLYPLASGSPHVFEGKTLICFTHPRDDMALPVRDYAKILNSADYILCQNSWSTGFLRDHGTRGDKLRVLIRAADPTKFVPHDRAGRGKVGFCTAFYERKRPELVLELIRALPEREFLLVGKKWQTWDRFGELQALPNLEYRDAEYSEYPRLYAQMDVFVSPALLEGGPFPLLEAMMCNVVPVASRTGFAPDLIREGSNGFIFETDAGVAEVAALVEKAFALKGDVSATVRQYTWRYLAGEIERMIGLPHA